MSEYQYYEFRAIDRPLEPKEMEALRALSTRAEITPVSFTNTYHYGDFRGNPATLMDRYFDAFVYVANWGTHWLMFRIPRDLIDVEAASSHCTEDADEYGGSLSLKVGKEHVVLEFRSEDEEGEGWVEGEHWMPSLISLRDELLRGDYRALYLGWLASLGLRDWGDEESEDFEAETDEDFEHADDRLEPPVPPGLAKLSAPLRALAEFLRVEDELIEVACAGSAGEPPAAPSRAELARWIERLPAAERNDYLLRFLAEDGDLKLRAEMLRRFREVTAPRGARAAPGSGQRTAAQLLAARNDLVAAKKRKAAQRAARVKARREREEAELLMRYLDGLATREPETWREVDALIATKRPRDYDRAVSLLVDLKKLAARDGQVAETEARIRELRARHSSKPSLLRRLDENDLGR